MSRESTLPVLIDAHAHMIWPDLFADLESVIDHAHQNGVHAIINTGIRLADFSLCLGLRERFPEIFHIIGLHPEEIRAEGAELQLFAEEFRRNRSAFVGLGEIGLDFFETKDPHQRAVQEKAFRFQLHVADEMQVPVLIHCRYAEKKAIQILEEPVFQRIPTVVMHCFGGASKYIARCLDHVHWYFTIPTSVVYKPLHQALARQVPLDRMMVETDAPFLKPRPELARNEPQYVRDAAEKVAEIQGQSIAEVARVTTANCRQIFSLPI